MGQADDHAAATGGRLRELHCSTVGRDVLSDDRQPEPGARAVLHADPAPKALEHPLAHDAEGSLRAACCRAGL